MVSSNRMPARSFITPNTRFDETPTSGRLGTGTTQENSSAAPA